jgi:hypothetical protein
MLLLLLAVLALQETETISKTHREGYQGALVEYDRAVLITEKDPKEALQVIERIFDNKKLDRKDRRLIFERAGGQLSRAFDFFPNQARGRIRLVLAKNDPDNAATLVAGAISDLKASSEAGVKSSDDLLKAARIAQERLKYVKPPEPPKESGAEKVFHDSWLKLIDERKFRAARDLVEARTSPLSAEKKKDYLRDTEERCRKFVAAALDDFLKAIELNIRPVLLRQVKPADFARLFALPPESDLVGVPSEPLAWARTERPLLDKIRLSDPRADALEAAPLLEALLAQMLAADAFDRTGENRWFKVSGQLAFHFVEDVLLNLAAMSKDATSERRQKLREVAEKCRARWSEALAKVPREILLRNQVHENPRRLTTLMEEFPVDSAEIDNVNLDACFAGEAPDAALENVISALTQIRDQQAARLPKEALRKLLTELVAATALHELLAGKSVEEVGKGLQELGRSLAQAGGPADPTLWGPKVQRVFAGLK